MASTVTLKRLRWDLTQVVDRVRVDRERFLVTAYGRPIAAIVPVEDLEVLEGKRAKQKATRKRRRRSAAR